jgi:hypothetical protein
MMGERRVMQEALFCGSTLSQPGNGDGRCGWVDTDTFKDPISVVDVFDVTSPSRLRGLDNWPNHFGSCQQRLQPL